MDIRNRFIFFFSTKHFWARISEIVSSLNGKMIRQNRVKRSAGYALCSLAAISTVFFLALSKTGVDNEAVLIEVPAATNYPRTLLKQTAPSTQESEQYLMPVVVNLIPGASSYYAPRVQPIGPPVIDGDPMGLWGDIFQRVTSELATDTAEVANLDRQV